MSLEEKYKNDIERLTTEMNDKEKRYVDTSTLAVVLKWLTLLPNIEFRFVEKSLNDALKNKVFH